MGNVIIWADIPVINLPRAMKFYGHVTGQEVMQFPDMDDVAVIGNPTTPGNTAMISADLYVGGTPSKDGATVYLNPNGDMDGLLARVVEAGGEIDRPKAFMGEMVGWIATFFDTEGNRLGVQALGSAPE
jgi:predicted enzyme related to lactoylglutathione lyase